MAEPVLVVRGISKHFGGVVALNDVSFEIAAGECHAVVGENGAGKTTLINILHGAVQLDAGSFELLGRRFERLDPLTSMANGLNVIHQELALVDSLRVMENIFLSSLQGRNRWIVKNQKTLRADAARILESLGSDIDPMQRVESLSTSRKQVVEIAKALASNPRLLIMDEPTASLTQGETERLFEMIRSLKKQGISVIFVSHRLHEVLEISDRVTVLRDGRYIGTVRTADTTVDEIIRMMVGREVDLYHKLDADEAGRETLLQVENLSHPQYFRNVSFSARSGEILCFAGLVGAGRTELAQTVFGFLQPSSGTIRVRGEPRSIRSPREAMALGLGMLPEDRKNAAVIGPMNVRENISIAVLPRLQTAGFVRRREESDIVRKFVERLHIKTAGVEQSITSLSGGNQQKVMIARWIASSVSILIVDEPTQGVDVGAKAEIHRLLRELARQGVAVVVISSDLPEVLSISDRIIVMRGGTIAGELPGVRGDGRKYHDPGNDRSTRMNTQTRIASVTRRLPNISVGWGVLLALFLEIVLISVLSPFFLQANNIFNVLKSMSIIAIVGTGMTMVVIVGGLDLSVGSAVGLGGMVAAALMTRMGVHPLLAVLAGIGTGAFSGFAISLLVNRLKINSIIVTLAMLSILRGFTYMISRGSNIFIKRPAVNFLGQGYIGIVPFPVILMILFVVLGTLFLRFTVIGRQIYAIGGNERAAKLAGIRVNGVRTIVFIATSALAAFPGLVTGGMLGSAEMTAGTGLEMDVIAAVIIGGASLKGGRGTIIGSLIGAAIMGILRNGFILLGFSYEAQIISIGVVIILAVTIDSLRTSA